jgi:hypothetical protein
MIDDVSIHARDRAKPHGKAYAPSVPDYPPEEGGFPTGVSFDETPNNIIRTCEVVNPVKTRLIPRDFTGFPFRNPERVEKRCNSPVRRSGNPARHRAVKNAPSSDEAPMSGRYARPTGHVARALVFPSPARRGRVPFLTAKPQIKVSVASLRRDRLPLPAFGHPLPPRGRGEKWGIPPRGRGKK